MRFEPGNIRNTQRHDVIFQKINMLRTLRSTSQIFYGSVGGTRMIDVTVLGGNINTVKKNREILRTMIWK
jgi:hypothetical protein